MFESNYDFIWRLIRRLGVSEGDVDDAAQRVFVVAARRAHEIAEGSERAFLFGTAMRIAASTRAARHLAHPHEREWETFHAAGPRGADELLDRQRARALLDAVLEEMPPDLRSAFVLFELDGLTCPEIAELLRLPLGTVASRLRRARDDFQMRTERLRRRLQRGGS